MKTWINYNWLKLLAVAMTSGALAAAYYSKEYPYAYYQFMNWAVLGAAIITAKQASQHGKSFFVWLFIFVAVIFNPIAPFNLRVDVWQLADLIVIVLFVGSLLAIKPIQVEGK